MRIAIFSDTYVPEVNGVAKTLSKYTHYLEERGIEYQLFIPKSQSLVPAVPHVQRFKSLPFILYPDCRLALPNPVYIKQTLQEFRPDLIHIATPFNLGLQGLHYGKKLQIPMVASYHTHFDDYLNYYHLQFMKNWIWKYMEWFHRQWRKSSFHPKVQKISYYSIRSMTKSTSGEEVLIIDYLPHLNAP